MGYRQDVLSNSHAADPLDPKAGQARDCALGAIRDKALRGLKETGALMAQQGLEDDGNQMGAVFWFLSSLAEAADGALEDPHRQEKDTAQAPAAARAPAGNFFSNTRVNPS